MKFYIFKNNQQILYRLKIKIKREGIMLCFKTQTRFRFFVSHAVNVHNKGGLWLMICLHGCGSHVFGIRVLCDLEEDSSVKACDPKSEEGGLDR